MYNNLKISPPRIINARRMGFTDIGAIYNQNSNAYSFKIYSTSIDLS